MRAAFRPKGAQPLTQAQQAGPLLQLIWGCDERMLPKMDAASMCDAKGIRRADIREKIAEALANRREAVARGVAERMA